MSFSLKYDDIKFYLRAKTGALYEIVWNLVQIHKKVNRSDTDGKSLYTLIPLEEFKAVLGVDDREDKITRFCLVTSTLTIEQSASGGFYGKSILNGGIAVSDEMRHN